MEAANSELFLSGRHHSIPGVVASELFSRSQREAKPSAWEPGASLPEGKSAIQMACELLGIRDEAELAMDRTVEVVHVGPKGLKARRRCGAARLTWPSTSSGTPRHVLLWTRP